jgi:hypothetical protein
MGNEMTTGTNNIMALKAVARRRTVDLGNDQKVHLRGVGFMRLAELAVSYPAVQSVILAGFAEIQKLVVEVPGFVIDAIHHALGDDTPEGREEVANLDPDTLLTIFETVVDLTMPEGGEEAREAFMKRLRAAVKKVAPSLEIEAA